MDSNRLVYRIGHRFPKKKYHFFHLLLFCYPSNPQPHTPPHINTWPSGMRAIALWMRYTCMYNTNYIKKKEDHLYHSYYSYYSCRSLSFVSLMSSMTFISMMSFIPSTPLAAAGDGCSHCSDRRAILVRALVGGFPEGFAKGFPVALWMALRKTWSKVSWFMKSVKMSKGQKVSLICKSFSGMGCWETMGNVMKWIYKSTCKIWAKSEVAFWRSMLFFKSQNTKKSKVPSGARESQM